MKIGIIGGSGLDNPNILKESKKIEINTKYGKPSSLLTTGKINDIDVVIIARHGTKHTITPTNVNNRANIMALKEVGVTHIITTTAVGSLKEEIERGDFVIIDQFIDFTRLRKVSFYDDFNNGVQHCPMATPFDTDIRAKLINNANKLNYRTHDTGTVITIEGPRFSTKAESKMFQTWGADIINMSIAPECILANEIGIPYASIAMSTDYDCWKDDEEPVNFDEILKVFNKNVEKVISLLVNTINDFNK